jgi:hypothetical protein
VILSGRTGNRELRLFEASALIPPPGSRMALSGTALRAQQLGVAAVACAVQLVSESLGIPVMRVYKGDAEKRRPLSTRRRRGCCRSRPRATRASISGRTSRSSLELEQGAFLWKNMTKAARCRARPVDPRAFKVERPQMNAPRTITARIDGRNQDVTDKVIFIRGWTPVARRREPASRSSSCTTCRCRTR